MSFLDHALHYAAEGFAVFPLVPGGKEPATAHGCKDATTDEARIRSWWEADSRRNIGIATGAASGVWVLDIDGRTGAFALDGLELEHEPLPATLVALTGGGGKHYYFAHVPGLRNRAGVVRGIDVRADGGYVVAPPSLHPSGEVYRWDEGTSGIGEAPAWLLELVRSRPKPRPTPPQAAQEPLPASVEPKTIRDPARYALGALRAATRDVASAPDGERNATLNKRAFSLVEHIQAGHLTREVVEAELGEAARSAGLGLVEVTRTLDSALRGAHPLPTPSPAAPEGAPAAPATTKVVLPTKAPMRAAEAYLDACHRDPQGRLLLRRWRQGWWTYRDGAYVELADEDLEAQLWAWLDQALIDGKDGPTRFEPTASKVNNVKRALLGCGLTIDSEVDPPVWVGASDSPGRLQPVANGLLDIRTRTLYPPSPDLFATAAIPIEWTGQPAHCPRWKQFLADVWGDDFRSVDLLQEWFGYLLTPDTSRQKLMLIIGPKRSGKGTIARILTALLGPRNVAAATLGTLGSRFGLHPLLGKLATVVPDARLGGKTDPADVVQTLLSLTGEDSVLVDRKGKDALTVRPSARVTICSNELPRFIDSSGAIVSRCLVLETRKSFYGEENFDLEAQLLEELPGILAWAVGGHERLRAQGWSAPSVSGDTMTDLVEMTSTVAEFVAERCYLHPDTWVDQARLYAAYCDFAKDQGRLPESLPIFARNLRAYTQCRIDRRYEDGRRSRRFVGISLQGALAVAQ